MDIPERSASVDCLSVPKGVITEEAPREIVFLSNDTPGESPAKVDAGHLIAGNITLGSVKDVADLPVDPKTFNLYGGFNIEVDYGSVPHTLGINAAKGDTVYPAKIIRSLAPVRVDKINIEMARPLVFMYM